MRLVDFPLILLYYFIIHLIKAVISMYKSFINIKHLNRSHLYWGIDKTTGDVVDIDTTSELLSVSLAERTIRGAENTRIEVRP